MNMRNFFIPVAGTVKTAPQVWLAHLVPNELSAEDIDTLSEMADATNWVAFDMEHREAAIDLFERCGVEMGRWWTPAMTTCIAKLVLAVHAAKEILNMKELLETDELPDDPYGWHPWNYGSKTGP